MPLLAVAVVSRQGRAGGSALRRVYPADAMRSWPLASLAELSELSLPQGSSRHPGGFVFFTLGVHPGESCASRAATEGAAAPQLYGVACIGSASGAASGAVGGGGGGGGGGGEAAVEVAVVVLSLVPLYGLLHARLAAHAAALFPSWSEQELSDSNLQQLHGSLSAPCALGQEELLWMGEAIDPRALLAASATAVLRGLKLLLLEGSLLLLVQPPHGQACCTPLPCCTTSPCCTPYRAAPPLSCYTTYPAVPPHQALPPQLGCSALLALASLLPHGLLPAGAAPPLPQRNPASLGVLGDYCAVLPAVCGWHAAALRPAEGRAWLGAAVEPAGLQLAPLASAVLTLHPREAAAGAQAGWSSLCISAASASDDNTALLEATVLTPQVLHPSRHALTPP